MACNCGKSKTASTTSSTTKKVDTSAAQRKVAQSLPLISVKKPSVVPTSQNKISKRQ
jgi:hypothetical protein